MGERSDEVNRHYDTDAADAAGADEIEVTEDTTEIRAGIEETRAEMSETIEAIQERLNPQHLKEQVKDQVREQFQEAKATVREATIGKAEDMARNVGNTIDEARYGLMETIRQNPVPAALVGLGLGWLFMNRQSAPDRRYSRYNGQSSYYRGSQPQYDDRQGYTGRISAYADSYDTRWADQGEHDAKGSLHRAQGPPATS